MGLTPKALHGIVHGQRAAQGTKVLETRMPGAGVEPAQDCSQGILSSIWSAGHSRRFRRTPVNTAISDPLPFPSIRAFWVFRLVSAFVLHGLLHGRSLVSPQPDPIPGHPFAQFGHFRSHLIGRQLALGVNGVELAGEVGEPGVDVAAGGLHVVNGSSTSVASRRIKGRWSGFSKAPAKSCSVSASAISRKEWWSKAALSMSSHSTGSLKCPLTNRAVSSSGRVVVQISSVFGNANRMSSKRILASYSKVLAFMGRNIAVRRAA